MSEMRLVVAGAAGRMGRVLIQVIHETPGATLAGAIEQADSIAIGQDAAPRGCGQTGVEITGDALSAIAGADGILDFTSPRSASSFRSWRRKRASFTSSARPASPPPSSRGSRRQRAMRSLCAPAT